MGKFIIGTDDFGVGSVTYKVDKSKLIIKDLTITGNEEAFDELSDNDDSDWSFALYPPELYLRDVSFKLLDGKIEAAITEEIYDDCDVALYLMEHNDVEGVFTIDQNGVFLFDGVAYISGEEMKLKLEVSLNS